MEDYLKPHVILKLVRACRSCGCSLELSVPWMRFFKRRQCLMPYGVMVLCFTV